MWPFTRTKHNDQAVTESTRSQRPTGNRQDGQDRQDEQDAEELRAFSDRMLQIMEAMDVVVKGLEKSRRTLAQAFQTTTSRRTEPDELLAQQANLRTVQERLKIDRANLEAERERDRANLEAERERGRANLQAERERDRADLEAERERDRTDLQAEQAMLQIEKDVVHAEKKRIRVDNENLQAAAKRLRIDIENFQIDRYWFEQESKGRDESRVLRQAREDVDLVQLDVQQEPGTFYQAQVARDTRGLQATASNQATVLQAEDMDVGTGILDATTDEHDDAQAGETENDTGGLQVNPDAHGTIAPVKDAGAGPVSQAKLVIRAPVHEQPEGIKRRGPKPAEAVEMPVVLWIESAWQSSVMLPTDTVGTLEDLIKMRYLFNSTKTKAWGMITRNPETHAKKGFCVGFTLFQHNKGVMKWSRSGGDTHYACDVCIEKRRPCMWVVQNGGSFNIGLQPLPEYLRKGSSLEEVGAWVVRAT